MSLAQATGLPQPSNRARMAPVFSSPLPTDGTKVEHERPTKGSGRRRRAGHSRTPGNHPGTDETRDIQRPQPDRGAESSETGEFRPVPDRHAPAGWHRPCAGATYSATPPTITGGHDHRLRQPRYRNQRTQGRCFRFPDQTGRPHSPARTHQRYSLASQSSHSHQSAPAGRLGAHAHSAQAHRQAGSQPGTGVHQRRIR